MKIILCFSIIFLFFAQTVFANSVYVESEDVVPVEMDASFISDGIIQFTWDKPDESDLETFKLYKSTSNSQPEENYVLNSKTSMEYEEEVADGVSYYRMCVYTILQTKACGDVIAIYGKWNTVLDPIVDEFIDIEGHWAEQFIEKLRVMSVVQGDSEGNFEPNRNIYRSEAIKIIMLAFGIGGTSCHSEFFPDMASNDWFCDVVSKAYQEGYVQGDEGMLYPDREITRAEAVKIVLETIGIEVPEITEKPFDDVGTDQWYSKYIAKAKELNIVQGVGEGLFEPNRPITRAELAKIAAEAAEL